jgi:hypothetical protein
VKQPIVLNFVVLWVACKYIFTLKPFHYLFLDFSEFILSILDYLLVEENRIALRSLDRYVLLNLVALELLTKATNIWLWNGRYRTLCRINTKNKLFLAIGGAVHNRFFSFYKPNLSKVSFNLLNVIANFVYFKSKSLTQ